MPLGGVGSRASLGRESHGGSGSRGRAFTIAHDAVAILRAEAGRDPYDRRLTELIGELSTRRDEFRVRGAAHNVKFHRTGVKRFHHPVVGDLTLTFEALDLPADTGHRMSIYTAEPGSRSHNALNLLASWTSGHRKWYPGGRFGNSTDDRSTH